MLWKKKPQSKAGQEFLIDLETASAQPTPAGVKPFIKKHWKPITAAVCAAAVAAAMLIPKGGAKQASASAQYVETSPEKRNIVNSYSADGTITAADTYTVKPMVKGTVLTADFEVGDTVSKGNVLYTIDSSDMASAWRRPSSLSSRPRAATTTLWMPSISAVPSGARWPPSRSRRATSSPPGRR